MSSMTYAWGFALVVFAIKGAHIPVWIGIVGICSLAVFMADVVQFLTRSESVKTDDQ